MEPETRVRRPPDPLLHAACDPEMVNAGALEDGIITTSDTETHSVFDLFHFCQNSRVSSLWLLNRRSRAGVFIPAMRQGAWRPRRDQLALPAAMPTRTSNWYAAICPAA
jgi:hypothetical protein